MTSPAISVLIPVYNGAATVREAVGSIQRQTLADISIIVVDDGSTDATPAILAEMAREDGRVQILRKPNGGIVEALNHGLAHCAGRYVARHDADDIAHPERFARQVAYLDANPDRIATSSSARHIDGAGQPTGTFAQIRDPDLADPTWAPSREPYLLHPFLMVRTEALKSVGGYRWVIHAEDTDLYWRLREIGRLHHMNEILGDYRIHAESISSRSIRNGRTAAANAQLAGLSALRRQRGREDLTFTKARGRLYAEAESLEAVYRIACDGLDRDESDMLEIALAAKLVELAFYRPYELDLADCTFVGAAVRRHAARLAPANRAELDRVLAGTAARLGRKGMFYETRALIPPRLYPVAVAKLAVRAVLPSPAKVAAQRLLGRMPSWPKSA